MDVVRLSGKNEKNGNMSVLMGDEIMTRYNWPANPMIPESPEFCERSYAASVEDFARALEGGDRDALIHHATVISHCVKLDHEISRNILCETFFRRVLDACSIVQADFETYAVCLNVVSSMLQIVDGLRPIMCSEYSLEDMTVMTSHEDTSVSLAWTSIMHSCINCLLDSSAVVDGNDILAKLKQTLPLHDSDEVFNPYLLYAVEIASKIVFNEKADIGDIKEFLDDAVFECRVTTDAQKRTYTDASFQNINGLAAVVDMYGYIVERLPNILNDILADDAFILLYKHINTAKDSLRTCKLRGSFLRFLGTAITTFPPEQVTALIHGSIEAPIEHDFYMKSAKDLDWEAAQYAYHAMTWMLLEGDIEIQRILLQWENGIDGLYQNYFLTERYVTRENIIELCYGIIKSHNEELIEKVLMMDGNGFQNLFEVVLETEIVVAMGYFLLAANELIAWSSAQGNPALGIDTMLSIENITDKLHMLAESEEDFVEFLDPQGSRDPIPIAALAQTLLESLPPEE